MWTAALMGNPRVGRTPPPSRGQSQRELAPEFFHSRPVGVLPDGEGLLVVLRPVRRWDEHPHHQLSLADRRVFAVLEQHAPLHGTGGEALLQLVVEDPFDLGYFRPFHGASHPRHCLNVPRPGVVPGLGAIRAAHTEVRLTSLRTPRRKNPAS